MYNWFLFTLPEERKVHKCWIQDENLFEYTFSKGRRAKIFNLQYIISFVYPA